MDVGLLPIIFIAGIVMGMPLAFILGSMSITYFVFIGDVPLDVIGQRLVGGVNSFTLLAIPFFVLAGELMNRTGITTDLVKFAQLIIGKLPGALAHVNIIVSIIFAGLTGAAVADVAAVGSILIPAMEEEGYDPAYSAAVTTASSIIGPIIPPSIIMVIYGGVTGESIGALFIAGIVPGLIVATGLIILTSIFAIKNDHPRRTEDIPFKEALRITKNSILGLIMPIIIIGGIVTGIFTPTEAAAVASGYGAFIGFVVFRTLTIRDVYEGLIKAGRISAVILLIIGMAELFAAVLMYEFIPQRLAEFIMGYTESRVMFLLLTNIFLLFMGMIMETGANVILLAPILLPVAAEFGLHPLHFALVMLVNVNIGLTTPPLGVCIFTASPIAGVSFEAISKKAIPFIIMLIATLLFITFVPESVLFLPRLLGVI